MTPIEKSTLTRVAGFIEGLSYGADGALADGLVRALEMIDELLKEGEKDNA